MWLSSAEPSGVVLPCFRAFEVSPSGAFTGLLLGVHSPGSPSSGLVGRSPLSGKTFVLDLPLPASHHVTAISLFHWTLYSNGPVHDWNIRLALTQQVTQQWRHTLRSKRMAVGRSP